jgi:hypothetical protein
LSLKLSRGATGSRTGGGPFQHPVCAFPEPFLPAQESKRVVGDGH